MYSELTIKESGIQRERLLKQAEAKLLRRLCGVLADVQSILHHRTKCLSEFANVDQLNVTDVTDSSAYKAAVMAAHMVHTAIGNYPQDWDDEVLSVNHPFDKEQLSHDLRQRVTRSIARVWNGD